ncbi:histidinol-phosphate aminotransferase [Actinokineospora diospyrosa]|uniref:Histidinol-phosphate aminotransferase n=1 Tax=Actinokineospora diospyrosa TaxID=103728 RepID=A0ABT1IJ57_9PSEU|nr:histidinol-phosphate aminotransferase [Actinokineospora diospyrosa]
MAVSTASTGPFIRAAINGLPPYSAGRSVRDAAGGGAVASDLLGLAANEGPYGPFPAAAAAAVECVHSANLYPQSGFRSLRGELADFLGVGVERVAVGAGGIALIHHLSVALLDEGTTIVTGTPTFHAYALDARKQGASARTAPVRLDGGYDLAAMLELVDDLSRIVYVCNPNNPTGGIVTREELLRFVDAVPESTTVVVDEAYFEYARSTGYPDTIADRAFHRPNLVTLRTFSKAYGLAGLRVAYLVGSPALIEAVQKVQSNYEVTSVALAAARASLPEADELARRVELNRAGRATLTEGLRRFGFPPIDSHANFVYAEVGDGKLFAKALEAEGIIVRPANAMGDPAGARITVGTPEQVERTVEALSRVAGHVGPRRGSTYR